MESSSKPSILERLKKSVLVADGAMGTMVSSLSPRPVDCIEALCLTDPELITDIHRQYIRAGALLLETNTFGANRPALSRYHLEDKTIEINQQAVKLARAQAGSDAYIAGSIGPVCSSAGGERQITIDECWEALTEQISTLVQEGVDLIIFETFADTADLILAIQIAKKLSSLPVAASMTASRFGTTVSGEKLSVSAQRLIDNGADIIGLNCGYGIRAIEGALEYLTGLGVPVSVMPNAGFPEQVGGRLRYGASEEYFATEAVVLARMGAKIIGGCCGTTPAHIEAVARKLREERIVIRTRVRHEIEPAQVDQGFKSGKLLDGFQKMKLPIICEIDPPAVLALEKNTDAILAAAEAGASAFSMADNPLATIKIENLAFAAYIKKKADVPVIIHVTGRDRNLLGLQSFMLGAHVIGAEALLCITGDPSTLHGGPSNVFDANSIGLIKMAANLNRGRNLLGKDTSVPTDFSIGAAVNPNGADFAPQLRHLKNKVQAGARFALTQPLYEIERMKEFLAAVSNLGIKIYVGIMPVLSSRTAEYLHHEVPGISIPESLRDLLRKKDDPDYQMKTGLDHTRSLIEQAASIVDGFYLIAPHTKPIIISQLVAFARKIEKTRRIKK
jgi:methionine synthase / methylenetetrahydrofolate reductase(NADPH)